MVWPGKDRGDPWQGQKLLVQEGDHSQQGQFLADRRLRRGTFKKDDITYTVKIITNRAFLNCKKMYGTLRIPSSVARIKGGYTFADNKVLTNLIVAASVPIEGDHLFKGCNSIQTARIGNEVSTRGLFNACNSMKLVLFGPNAVRRVSRTRLRP